MLDKIKSLRGMVYKKMKEEMKEEKIELPGFEIRRPTNPVELPSIDDPRKVNVIYSILEPFAYVNIKWDENSKMVIYNVIEPKLTKKEEEMLKEISDGLVQLVEVGLSEIKDISKAIEYLQQQVNKIIKSYGIKLLPSQYIKIMYYIYRNFIGYDKVNTIMEDPNIEDISCDGVDIPIYVVHRKYGSIKTNVVFNNPEELRKFIVKLAERSGRYVSYAEPILDSTLPDGSRVAATLASDVATRGSTFTIRKFGKKPFSPIDQIKLNTANAEILAYLWYLLEHSASMLIVGGVATGKTSFLNSISMFIPPEAKIVSIEDTRELRLTHEHWVPGLARVGFGIPLPTGGKYGSVSLFDLLKEAFRQNPDYVIVGEVRGQEAYVLFQGMASGHPSLSTLHAGSVDTVIKRLTLPPINLSPTLMESLDIVIVMTHAKEKGKSARRIKEIDEILGVDEEGQVKKSVVFRWNPVKDVYEKINESVKLKKIAEAVGTTYENAKKEIDRRIKFINWLYQKRITDYLEVSKYINEYYKDPEKFSDIIGEIKEEKPQAPQTPVTTKKPKRLHSIWELLGFKFIKEKT